MELDDLKPRIGVSACLVGQMVRFDGSHRRETWVDETLAKVADLIPQCPEMAAGLGTPRESLRLVRPKGGALSLLGTRTSQDVLPQVTLASEAIVEALPPLDGYILKRNSPSCGLERVRIYPAREGSKNVPQLNGTGILAQKLKERFPLLPLVEEGHLRNPELRDHFMTRVYVSAALRLLKPKLHEIQVFHRRMKFLLLSYSQTSYTELGRLLANPERGTLPTLLEKYKEGVMKALAAKPTPKNRTNAIQHIYGYFKNKLEKAEKDHLLHLLEEYRQGHLPYMALLTAIKLMCSKFPNPYIQEQFILQPHPERLRLNYAL